MKRSNCLDEEDSVPDKGNEVEVVNNSADTIVESSEKELLSSSALVSQAAVIEILLYCWSGNL